MNVLTKYYCHYNKTTLNRPSLLEGGSCSMKLQTGKKSSRFATLACSCRKGKRVVLLNKLKQTLPQTVMLQLYYALVLPLLLYGMIIWGATYPTYLQKLKFLQNRAMRTIVGAHFQDSVNPYYSQLKILQIDDLFKFEVAKLVYGSLHNKTPN